MPAYHVIYTQTETDPGKWASDREAEGWHGVSVPDHVWVTGNPVRHLWVALTEMAMTTSRLRLASAFANNLARSPVEFAQAALTLQTLSDGRFEAGLGAGWDRAEAEATALRFPEPAERSQRLAEALVIARALFDDGSCRYRGRWYDVDVPTIGPPAATPPLLVSSASGRLTMRRIIGTVDVLELQSAGFSVPDRGSMDTRTVAAVSFDDLRRRIEDARTFRPDIVLGTFLPFGCGTEPVVTHIRQRLEGSPFAPLFGDAGEVADAVRSLGGLGYSRLQLGPVTPESVSALASALL